MKNRQEGFTLIELVSIIVILGIISISVMGISNSGDAQRVQASRDQVLLAVRTARHLAMAKASGSREIVVIADAAADSIDVQDGGTSITLGGVSYPYVLGNGIQLTDANLSFNKLGRTSAATISISTADASVSVVVSENGAAR